MSLVDRGDRLNLFLPEKKKQDMIMIISDAIPVKMPVSFGDATDGDSKLGTEFDAYAYCL